jgi:hypothetical protein
LIEGIKLNDQGSIQLDESKINKYCLQVTEEKINKLKLKLPRKQLEE